MKNEKKMKVLLTGASGFLGQYVLRSLIANNIETLVIGRKSPVICSGVTYKHVDLLNQITFDEFFFEERVTHLMHLAWYTEHGAYWKSHLNLDWLMASLRLVDAFCKAGGQKVVMAGTCAEYDWSNGYCYEDSTLLQPNSLYGAAKDSTRRMTEVLCADYEVKLAWGRIFSPYGRGEDQRRLIPSLIAVFENRCIPFGVNANAYRDFLHCEDVASAFLTLLQTDAVGAFNISSGQPVKIAEVVRNIANIYGADPDLVLGIVTSKPIDTEFLIGNNQKLIAQGWRQKYLFKNLSKNLSI